MNMPFNIIYYTSKNSSNIKNMSHIRTSGHHGIKCFIHKKHNAHTLLIIRIFVISRNSYPHNTYLKVINKCVYYTNLRIKINN